MVNQTPIQFKRSVLTATPPSLANGEPAYTSNGGILYIGDPDGTSGVIPIGGKRTPGTLTANQALVVNSTSYIDVLKTANLYIGSMSVNVINAVANSTVLGSYSNNELTTTWAIKTYVDGKAAGSSAAAGVNTTIQFNDSGSLGGVTGFIFNKTTDTITVGNSTVNSSINSTSFTGTSSNALALSGTTLSTITSAITGNADSAYANAVTYAGTIAGTAYSNAVANASNDATTKAGTAYSNAVAYAASNTYVNTNFLPKNNPTATGTLTAVDIIASGNLTINGTLTTVNTTNMAVTDSLIKLALNNSANTLDIGFYGTYNDGTSRYTGLAWDASTSTYELFSNTTVEPDTTINIAGTGYSKATLKAFLNTGALVSNTSVVNITANSTVSVALVANTLTLSSALGVTYGGTGRATLTAKSILSGNGTGAVTMTSGTAYQLLQLDASGDVIFGGLDGGTF